MQELKDKQNYVEGRVIRAESGRYLIDDGKQVIPCRLRGRLKRQRGAQARRVVVGDRVLITLTGTAPRPESEGVIEELLPRDNFLSRATPDGAKREQVLMANLERVFVVMSTHEPEFNPRLLDRFLAACSYRELEAVICLNKCDLSESPEYEAMLAPYRLAGYSMLFVSALSGEGLDALRESMAGRTSLFLGPSGSGKSSILTSIQVGLELATRSVSETTGKGRHTTSYTELHSLDFGGYVADSPGVREFGLWGIAEPELGTCFPEFHPYLGGCRYPDCSHSHEPDCAVKAAVEEKEIDGDRYESYLRILESIRQGKLGF